MIAAADAKILQVQILDKNSQNRTIVVYQCGPDIYYAATMDGLFDINRRRSAPTWLEEQLKALPASRQLDYLGNIKSEASHVPDLNEEVDVPEFVQR